MRRFDLSFVTDKNCSTTSQFGKNVHTWLLEIPTAICIPPVCRCVCVYQALFCVGSIYAQCLRWDRIVL